MLACDCGDNGPDFYNNALHKARKAHTCCECKREIPIGSEYEKAVGKWEGEFYTFKTCGLCLMIRETLEELGYCMAHGRLVEDYQDYLTMTHSRKTAHEILFQFNLTFSN